MKRLSIVLIVLFLAFILCGCGDITTTSNTTTGNDIKWMIAEHEFGDKYPYTEYYLNIYCYKSLVWFEDVEGNFYAINGAAKSSLLKKSSKYKGGTEKILKKGMTDLFTPVEAFDRCCTLNDFEFNSRVQN